MNYTSFSRSIFDFWPFFFRVCELLTRFISAAVFCPQLFVTATLVLMNHRHIFICFVYQSKQTRCFWPCCMSSCHQRRSLLYLVVVATESAMNIQLFDVRQQGSQKFFLRYNFISDVK